MKSHIPNLPPRIPSAFEPILQVLCPWIAFRIHSFQTKLPASRSSPASAAAAAKSPKPAASSATAEAASAPASPTRAPAAIACQHSQQKPETAPAARSASTPAREASNCTKENNQNKNDPEYRESGAPSGILISRGGRQAAQRNTSIIGNVPGQLPGGDFRRLAIIVLAQVGHHGAPGISRPRIIDHRFSPIAHFAAVFPLVGSDKQPHAAI